MRTSLITLTLTLLFGLSGFTEVSAADSSGVYANGSIKCKIFRDDGTNFKTGKVPLTVLVDQGPSVSGTSNLDMSFDFFVDTGRANGTQFDDEDKPLAKAALGAVSCSNVGEASLPNFVANATVRNADKDNAKLKGTLSFTDVDRNAAKCKWKATRTSVDRPIVPACDEP